MNNYAKGAKTERDAIKVLFRMGAICAFRSAGSHSIVDVVGIFRNKIILLQLKKGCKAARYELNSLKVLRDALGGPVQARTALIEVPNGVDSQEYIYKALRAS